MSFSVDTKLEKYEDNKDLVLEWATSLQYPLDEFYENLCLLNPMAKFYGIYLQGDEDNAKKIGYFVITMDTVVAFYIMKKFQLSVDPKDVFKEQVLDKLGVNMANLVSLDTYFLNVLLDHQKSFSVMGYSPFVCDRKEILETSHPLDFEEPKLAVLSDEERIWQNIKDEKMFLKKEELSPMIGKKQLYIFNRKGESEEEIKKGLVGGIGVLVKSNIFPNWSIGMFVTPKYRKQGVGTYVLQKMQNICIRAGKISCAGCAKENIGSRKTLQKSGMINRGTFLVVNL